jgi:tetratricopeptide (TPR) repeat protein
MVTLVWIAVFWHAVGAQGQRYGVLTDDHAVAQRTRLVFDRIVRAAGRRPGLVVDLTVLDTARIVGQALPGGLVVVSRGLIDLVGADDNALAFVLGHEVAHLVRDHHAALRSFGALGAERADSSMPVKQVQAVRALELEADRLGALFAMLAGYDATAAASIVQKLIASEGPDALHPNPRERADVIQRELADVASQLEIFRFGLFLLSTRQYLDAARVLEHVAGVFPGREILTAAGVAWHEEALRSAPAGRYQHLLVADASTRASLTRRYGLFESAPCFRRCMERAIVLYTQAADTDPSYAPALNNLAAAHLDLGERELGVGYVARALRSDPRLASAYNNRGIGHALAGDSRRAEEDWHRALALAPGRPEILENLARLHESLGHPDVARSWRSRFPAKDGETHETQSLNAIVPGTPLERIRDQLATRDARTIQLSLTGREIDDFVLYVIPSRGIVVAVRGGVVEMVGASDRGGAVTREGVRPGEPVARVELTYGRPRAVEHIEALSLWHYPARGLVVFALGDRVQAIWVGRVSR